MRTLFKVILSAAAAVALFSCGRNGGREANAPQASASPELRDTCVSFSADSCDTFGKWLSSRLKTDFTEEDFYDAAGERQSNFSISFTIDKDGDMKNIYIKGTDSTDISGFSPVQKFIIATLEDAPGWNPAVSGGVKVSTPMTVEVRMMPYDLAYETIYSRVDSRRMPYEEGRTYNMVSSIFRYGTHNNFMQWVVENLEYPEEAKADKIGGKVYVSGFIDSDGRHRGLEIQQGPSSTDNEYLEKAALDAIASMPPEDPYYENGMPVTDTIYFMVPIVFQAD